MKKRLFAILLVVAMFAIVACGKKDDTGVVDETQPTESKTEATEGTDEPDETDEVVDYQNQVTVGNTTELSGDWIPYWQNNAADYDVYNFITGLSTVAVTFDGEYIIDPTVVASHEVTDNDDGTRTYTWTINEGLVYNDGTPITAKDYVASIAFWSSKVVGDSGASNTYGQYFEGWSEFAKGESNVFKGVNLDAEDEMTYSVTIAERYIPYFYELAMASASPTKLSFWTDDTVEIKDDGEGVYFSENFTLEAFEERFNEARREVDRPATGPYYLKSYDEAAKNAVLEINENYAGDYQGQKPSIQTVIVKKVEQATAIDELNTGSVDVLTAMGAGDEINAGLDLVDEGGFSFTSYPRAGYGKLQFVADEGPTQFVEVRQAIGHLLDRNEFAKTFTGGFGSVVNGPYGEAMWFYQETRAELNAELNQYAYSLESAVALLEEGGWVYDAEGNDYTEGIRHKKLEDGTYMPLVIEWAASENNAVSELLVVMLQENEDVAAAGMQINQTIMSFPELLNWVYRDDSEDAKYGVPTFHMFNLASGYTPRYDLTNTYTTDPALIAQGTNTNFILDEDLAKLAADMVLVDPTNQDEFKSRFVDFIVKWNELLPDVPLYSNEYHDFYNEKIENWEVNDIVELVDVVLYANVKGH